MRLHGSCAARAEAAVLILGPAGAGKSDLVLRLLDRGWSLVADDQVELSAAPAGLAAAPPPPLRGLLEVRGLGIMAGLPAATAPVQLQLVVDCVPAPAMPRLPMPAQFTALGCSLPRLALDPFAASAPQKLDWALDVLAARRAMTAGAFAA
jgi:HPr kinase/phosphorylase